MSVTKIIRAKTVITVDSSMSRSEAVAFDESTGLIEAVGPFEDLTSQSPDATVIDLGEKVLMPGFVDSHGHPVLGGLACVEPAHWIAPYVGFPSYNDVVQYFEKQDAQSPAGQGLFFNGLDRSLQGAPELTNLDLDKYFPNRPVAVLDNSGHEVYFNTALLKTLGWVDDKPPADPVGARFGRNDDGSSNGRAYETSAMLAVLGKFMFQVIPHPLLSSAKWLKIMAENGVTLTSEHTYQSTMGKALTALAGVPHAPIRLSTYHMSIESDCGDPVETTAPESMLKKVGIKLWADGSPWVGTIASTIPYLDNETVRAAGITPGTHGPEMMNYDRTAIDAVIDANASTGWQFAFHCNGDIALDIVLDAYEYGLNKYGLVGSDHRWRVEHVGAARADQFKRAAELGVCVSMGPFQFIYWGDLLDGTLFSHDIGSQWQRFHDAVESGASVSFHNDGSVSPPTPLLNIKAAVTREDINGHLHGPEQRITLDQALRAQTINGAHHLKRDDITGSIEVGKQADFVVLDADPYAVAPSSIDKIKVEGTWLGGKPVDLAAFIEEIRSVDPSEHADLAHAAVAKPHNC